MGNCCGDGATEDAEPTFRELNYLDQQTAAAARRNGEVPPHMQYAAYSGNGYPPMGHPGYGLQPAPLHYPSDPLGGYYQPRGPLLLMDPYTGATYEYDQEAMEMYTDNERRYRRRKERQKSSSRDDNDRDGGDDEEIDKKRHRRRSSPNKPTENGGMVTSANVRPSTSKSENRTSAPKRQRSENYQPRDVMISYSRTDEDAMKKIKDKLQAQGISVWVDVTSIDAGSDFLSKIGEAIIDAKMFVCILSDMAVKSKYCRDEVALAYVSNTAVFPVNIQPKEQLLPLMDTGLKLQLANFKWTSLTDPATAEANLDSLVSTMKAELDDLRQLTDGGALSSPPANTSPATDGGEVTSPSDVAVGLDLQQGSSSPGTSPVSDRGQPGFQTLRLREMNRERSTLDDEVSHIMPDKFWTDRFGVSDHVMWDRFQSAFLDEFRNAVEMTFSDDDQHQLMDILKRELEVDEEERIFKYQFIAFCSVHGEALPVWQRVQEQARESFAMKEVFNMDSSVRVEAIENLGKFRSAAVIDALRDLLTDPDANVRAVATVSLSRTNANDPVTIRHILRMLTDKDRLVREAGCLALGHLQAREAIGRLTHLWRNDVISHVREAAAVALRQIGGPEVEEVMRMTKVLAEEIRTLTEMES